jgi:hypothetical protein
MDETCQWLNIPEKEKNTSMGKDNTELGVRQC